MKTLPIDLNNIREMTVIFRHAAASFKLDNHIRYDAIYIKEPYLTNQNVHAKKSRTPKKS